MKKDKKTVDLKWGRWDEPSLYDDFGNPLAPGYEYYKPWIYGK